MKSIAAELDRPATGSASIDMRLLGTALLVCAGYYLGSKVGFFLTFTPNPVSVLWPPNSVLAAALLLTPLRSWWALLLAAFPAHWAAQLQSDVPAMMILSWFISNCCEALIGASFARYVLGGPLHLASLREVSVFCAAVGFAGPFLSSFVDAAFVAWNDWGNESYWQVWRLRFTSNVLAAVTVAPLIITWVSRGTRVLQEMRAARYVEAFLLVLSVGFISFLALYQMHSGIDRALLYLPLPLLLWAAVRFGTLGTSTAAVIVAISAICGVAHGEGPFSGASTHENVLSIQLFLIGMFLPLMFLAALVEERARASTALGESEERYREIVESQTDLVCRFLPDTTLTFVNDAYCRFFGRQREELIGQKFLTHIPLAARDRVVRNIAGLTRNRPVETQEHEVVLPDGSVGWQQWVNHALIDADGQVREFQSIGRDVTERVRIERALRESEERVSLATESANLGLWVYQPEQDAVWMSEKGREIYGVGRDEPLSPKSFLRCIPPDEHEAVRNAFTPVQSRQDALEIEHRIVKPGGATSWVITRGRFLHDEQGKLMELIGVTIDITAQKQTALQQQATREEMAHLARIAAVGEIAVSLAHELTQPLTGIMGNADAGRRLLERGNTDPRELREILVDIKADVSRAGDVVHGIRRMGRKGRTIREPVNLNEIVKSVIGLLKPEALLHRCELKISLERDLPVIEGDPTELQQVLINLVVNSLDAMRQTPAHGRQVAIATKRNGRDAIEVSVQDRGVGIPDEARAQVFEKFFTTKPQGLGVGLAITRSIIQSHGGMITAENIAGGGARFSFVLPARSGSS